jgi:hypothetical protein
MFGAGFLLLVVGYAVIAVSHSSAWDVGVALTLIGLGFGVCSASVSNLIFRGVGKSVTSSIAAMNYTARLIGGSLAVQAIGAILGHFSVDRVPTETGFIAAGWLCAGVLFVGFLSTLLIPGGAPSGDEPLTTPATPGVPTD